MTGIRTTLAALLAAGALALAGCSGGTSPEAPPETPAVTTGSDAGSGAPTASDGAEATPLTGMVGTADDPEAYEIALLDAEGSPVTSLPAGDYALTFADGSQMHNFRLSGPGDVDVATDVQGTDTSTVTVTLEAGTYTFVCDPHEGTMRGEVEVTG
ncbi:cupredoxin domain-containing protein [Agrococcus baldri]|uniref:Blue (type 1) copper domain-containing protein n=1 Tax=Agrococcus baldri TaxID=153730 RepID=A0AA87RJW3_9MICO|nr:plastocyanin/azurin family copper-binding protein [Agrococcus baldri]GEK80618.1 hypothetical protein ABA31_19690 [Agrococcus baldri]